MQNECCVSMLRKLENSSWATLRGQCKVDQFAQATNMAAENRAAAACIVIALLMEEDNKRRTRGPAEIRLGEEEKKERFMVSHPLVLLTFVFMVARNFRC